ncbi:Amidase enhancer [subsurface metagenome]
MKNIKIYKKTGSGRVKEFILIFEGNEKQILKGNTFRLALDPKVFRSLLIQGIKKKRINDEYIYTFSGKGYGHGVGLSQWGVKGMAEQGFAYERIVAYYYRGTQLGNYDMVSLP